MEQCHTIVSPKSRAAYVPGVFGREQAKVIERLPFTIKRVRSEADMRKAVQIRHAAYARHLPQFAQTLLAPESSDYEDDTVVLLAESKLDGLPLGTARIHTNQQQPLSVENSVTLPSWLQGRRLAEVSRLGIGEGRIGRLAKIALMKACFEYCESNHVEWLVVTGRAPIDRQYEQLLFIDVLEDKAMVPLADIANIAHRVMAFEIATCMERWRAAGHPLLAFFHHIRHPDIDIGLQRSMRVPRSRALHPTAVPARMAGLSMA